MVKTGPPCSNQKVSSFLPRSTACFYDLTTNDMFRWCTNKYHIQSCMCAPCSGTLSVHCLTVYPYAGIMMTEVTVKNSKEKMKFVQQILVTFFYSFHYKDESFCHDIELCGGQVHCSTSMGDELLCDMDIYFPVCICAGYVIKCTDVKLLSCDQSIIKMRDIILCRINILNFKQPYLWMHPMDTYIFLIYHLIIWEICVLLLNNSSVWYHLYSIFILKSNKIQHINSFTFHKLILLFYLEPGKPHYLRLIALLA